MALKFKVLIVVLIVLVLVCLVFLFKFTKKKEHFDQWEPGYPPGVGKLDYKVMGAIKEVRENSIILDGIPIGYPPRFVSIEVLVGEQTTIKKITFSGEGMPQEEKINFEDLKKGRQVTVTSSQNILESLKTNTPIEAIDITVF